MAETVTAPGLLNELHSEALLLCSSALCLIDSSVLAVF